MSKSDPENQIMMTATATHRLRLITLQTTDSSQQPQPQRSVHSIGIRTRRGATRRGAAQRGAAQHRCTILILRTSITNCESQVASRSGVTCHFSSLIRTTSQNLAWTRDVARGVGAKTSSYIFHIIYFKLPAPAAECAVRFSRMKTAHLSSKR